jgi:hypothetical protein
MVFFETSVNSNQYHYGHIVGGMEKGQAPPSIYGEDGTGAAAGEGGADDSALPCNVIRTGPTPPSRCPSARTRERPVPFGASWACRGGGP